MYARDASRSRESLRLFFTTRRSFIWSLVVEAANKNGVLGVIFYRKFFISFCSLSLALLHSLGGIYFHLWVRGDVRACVMRLLLVFACAMYYYVWLIFLSHFFVFGYLFLLWMCGCMHYECVHACGWVCVCVCVWNYDKGVKVFRWIRVFIVFHFRNILRFIWVIDKQK